MAEIQPGVAIDELYQLKTRRLALEAEAESLKRAEKDLEALLIEKLEEDKVTLMRGGLASFSITKLVVPTVDDWAHVHEFIQAKNDFSLLQKRINVSAWREYYQEEELLVPGTSAFEQVKANLRKL